MHILASVEKLVKTRDELRELEHKVHSLQRSLDYAISDILDWLVENDHVKREKKNGKSGRREMERPVVGGGSTQGEGSVGADDQHDSGDEIQD